jgi:hypothetical protein
MKRFKAYEPEQGYLLPPSVAEWLPSDHLVYFLSEVVNSLDLTAIYSSYADGVGQPPYPPRMIVQVWLYGYCRGIVLLFAASLALIDLILLRMAVRLFPRVCSGDTIPILPLGRFGRHDTYLASQGLGFSVSRIGRCPKIGIMSPDPPPGEAPRRATELRPRAPLLGPTSGRQRDERQDLPALRAEGRCGRRRSTPRRGRSGCPCARR